MAGNLPPGCTDADIDRAAAGSDEPLDPPTPEEEEAMAWEYWHERAHKAEAKNAQQREALEAIAAFGRVNLAGEWEHGLRDIIRSITDRAQRELTQTSALGQ